jgi:predicted transcriptional regulator
MTTKSTKRAWAGVIIVALLVIVGASYLKNHRSIVVLRPHGKATFYRGGLFSRDAFELVRDGTKWRFESGELILPFECPYNNYRTLRLENDGKVYMLDDAAMTREELQVVNGEWSYDATDHWQSIFDLD